MEIVLLHLLEHDHLVEVEKVARRVEDEEEDDDGEEHQGLTVLLGGVLDMRGVGRGRA